MSARGLAQLGRWLATGDERGAINLSLGSGWSAVRPHLLVALLLTIVNLALLFAVTAPAWRASSEVGSAVRLGAQAHDALEPALARARRSYGKVVDAEAGIRELRDRVAERSGAASEVVSTLRAAVDAAGLDADRIRYQPQEVPELGLLQMQIELPVRGSYRQLRRFLEELLEGPAFLVLERVAVSTETADANQGLRVSLRTSVFLEGESIEVTGEASTPASAASNPDPVARARQLSQRLAGLPDIPLAPEEFVLDLGRLDAVAGETASVRRNPFAFAGSAVRQTELPTTGEPVAVEPLEPVEPVMPYKLLGITRYDGALMATLSDGDHVHLLRQGESLPEGYRVLEIDLVSVRLDAGTEIVRLSLRNDEGIQRERRGDDTNSPQPEQRKNKKSRGSQ